MAGTSKSNAAWELEVGLSHSHLKRVSQCEPIVAITELIWNSLDAGSTKINVSIKTQELGGISEVHVIDNGAGIHPDALSSAFGNLGESLKVGQQLNSRGHRVHGNLGEGRFKAYSLGNQVQWITNNGSGSEIHITGNVDKIQKFNISEKSSPGKTSGTKFTAFNGYGSDLKMPPVDRLIERLSVVFAPKLLVDKEVKIVIDGIDIDPESRIEAEETTPLSGFDQAKVKTVLWKPTRSRLQEIVWCDEAFNARTTEQVDLDTSADCSVFIASPLVSEAFSSNTFDLRESTPLNELKRSAIELATEFAARTNRNKILRTVVDLKEKGIYPYDGKPKGKLEELERNVFAVCATKIIESIPGIASGSKDRQKLTLHLLRTAVESSPSAVQHVFEKILNLPKDQIEEFSELLNRTSIAGLIKLGRLVLNRKDFILGLEQILFEKAYKKRLLERTQLHKIIENETWIFGEEFSLGTSDETLSDVLIHHRALLNHGDEVVEYDGGKVLIPDLVLSKQFKFGAADKLTHLVVELKRPSAKIGFDQLSQIQKYAAAVSTDPKFDKTRTRWIFVAVSNELSDSIETLFQSDDGRIDPGKNPNVELYIKPWSAVIQSAKGRMDYLWERTEIQSSKGEGMNYLNRRYPDILGALEEEVAKDA